MSTTHSSSFTIHNNLIHKEQVELNNILGGLIVYLILFLVNNSKKK